MGVQWIGMDGTGLGFSDLLYLFIFLAYVHINTYIGIIPTTFLIGLNHYGYIHTSTYLTSSIHP